MNNTPINPTPWVRVAGQNERIELVIQPTGDPNITEVTVNLVAQSVVEEIATNFLSKISIFGLFKGIEFKHEIGIKKAFPIYSNDLSQAMIKKLQEGAFQGAFKIRGELDREFTQKEALDEFERIGNQIDSIIRPPPQQVTARDLPTKDIKRRVAIVEQTDGTTAQLQEQTKSAKPKTPTPKLLDEEIAERDKMHAQYKIEDAPEEPEEEMQIVPFVAEGEPADATGVEDITAAYEALEKQLRTMSANIKGELKEKVDKALAECKSLADLKGLVQELETDNKLSTPPEAAAASPTVVQPPAEPQIEEKDRQLELRQQLRAQIDAGVKLFETQKEQLQPLEKRFGVTFSVIRSALEMHQEDFGLLGLEGPSHWGISVSKMDSKQLQALQTKVKEGIEDWKKLLDIDFYKIKQAKQELKDWEDLKKSIEEKAAASVKKKFPQLGPFNALKKAVYLYDQEIKKAAEASQTTRNLQGFVDSVHDRYDKIQKGLAKIEKHEEQLSFSDQLAAEPENSESAKQIKADFLARVKDEINLVEREIEDTWNALYGVRLGKEGHFSFKGALVEQEVKKTKDMLVGVRGDKTALNREQLINYENQVARTLQEARNNLQLLLEYSRKLADADHAAQEKMKAVNARITELEQGPEPDLAEQLKKLRDPLIAEYGKLPRTLSSFKEVEECTKTLGDITGKLEAALRPHIQKL